MISPAVSRGNTPFSEVVIILEQKENRVSALFPYLCSNRRGVKRCYTKWRNLGVFVENSSGGKSLPSSCCWIGSEEGG